MDSLIFRKANPYDFQEILKLQKENLITSLGQEERSEGFLSVEFSEDQLFEINQELGISVALENGYVIGYLMAETMEYARQFPLLAYMMGKVEKLTFEGSPLKGKRIFVYGPVCIDRDYRGKGILEGLFNTVRTSLRDQFERGVLFISKDNPHSFHAHLKLGMSVVDEFEFDGQQYWTLGFGL